jgi:hypothetical protein
MANWRELKENVTIEFGWKTIDIFNFHGSIIQGPQLIQHMWGVEHYFE